MTAGEIIDCAARLYRRHWVVLLKVILVPSMVSYAGILLMSVGVVNTYNSPADAAALRAVVMMLGGAAVWIMGKLGLYAILGGASRSLFNHFFDGRPLLVSEIHASIRQRLAVLLKTVIMVAILSFVLLVIATFVFGLLATIGGALYGLMGMPETGQQVLSVLLFVLVLGGLLVVVLMAGCRVVYVPQIVMVEGKEASDAISRSLLLAGGETRRFGAIILFWGCSAISILLLLSTPLFLFGYEMYGTSSFESTRPLWYWILQQTIVQVTEIAVTPVAILGFTLLYFDTRVRREGFDVEMVANRILPPAKTWETLRNQRGAPPMPVMTVSSAVRLRPGEGAPVTTIEPDNVLNGPGVAAESRACARCGARAASSDKLCATCGWTL